MALKYYYNAILLKKYRKLHDALIEVNEGINYINKTALTIWLIFMYSIKAEIQVIRGDIQGAGNALQNADEIKNKINPVPMTHSTYLLSQSILSLHHLEESIKKGNASEIIKYKKNTLKTGKKAVKNSKKYAPDRVEVNKLMGVCYWLVNKQKKALKWWDKSIKEGERLGARLELSRTYFEVSKRLLESKSKYSELSGIAAEEYLDKAKTMFEEMDLQWDLDELAKVKG
ncbi:MAG: hypothetical protein GY863_15035 [bacterium]|nr:hypothetical protein [bacterium]